MLPERRRLSPNRYAVDQRPKAAAKDETAAGSALPVLRVSLLELGQFRQIIDDDVARPRVLPHEILMLGLRDIEAARFDPRRDRFAIFVRRFELSEELLHRIALLLILREDGGAVSRPYVGSLPVHLSWIVGDVEEDFQQLVVANLRGVEGDPNRFRKPFARRPRRSIHSDTAGPPA